MLLGPYASARSASPIFSYAARHSGFRRVAGFTLLTGAPLMICRLSSQHLSVPSPPHLLPPAAPNSHRATRGITVDEQVGNQTLFTFFTGTSTRFMFTVYGISSTWMICVPVKNAKTMSEQRCGGASPTRLPRPLV